MVTQNKIKIALTLIILVILAGTAGFVLIEGWTPLDALYMTTITLSTVGFKEVNQLGPAGRIFTILLMSFSNKLWHLYLLYLITGVSFGLLMVIANASLIEGKIKNKNSAVSLGHSFFAIGAISSPFVTSIIVGNSLDWRIIYYIMAAFLVLLIILKLIQKEENKVTGGLKDNPIKIPKVFNNKSKNISDAGKN